MLREPHLCSFLVAVKAAFALRNDELKQLGEYDREHVGAPIPLARLGWTSEIGSRGRAHAGAFWVDTFA